SCVGIKGKQRASIEIVARPRIVIPIRCGIARAPVHQVQVRIIRPGYPCRSTAMLPALPTPGLPPRLTRSRHRPCSPAPLAGFGIVGIYEPSYAGLGTRNPNNNLAINRERRGGNVIALLVIVYDTVPANDSRFCVESDQMAIYRSVENRVVQDGHAPIHGR